MWKLKVAEGGSPWLRTTNNHVGRQVWEFDPELGTPEEIAEVERVREEFRKNRFRIKCNSDLLMKLQYSKANPIEINIPKITLGENEDVTEEAVSNTLRKALICLSTKQAPDGHWATDYGGQIFLLCDLIMALYVIGALNTVLSLEHQKEIRRFYYNRQNEDGGWPFQIEDRSTMFGSAAAYVTLRLLGEGVDGGDGAMRKGREWILQHGGATHSTPWGKFWLSVLGVYDWSGNIPIFPEMIMLPKFIPFHPGNMWTMSRVFYIPMTYLQGKRFVGPLTPTVLSLREELYSIPYEKINWNLAMKQCAKEDLYYKNSPMQDIFWAALSKIESIFHHWPCNKLREKALKIVMEHNHYEDETTRYICANPASKVLNMVCCWVEDQNSEAFKLHLPRVYDYLWLAEDGMKIQAFSGSQFWDTSFAIQAIMSTKIFEEHGPNLKKAYDFIKQTQILEDCPDNIRFWYRNISKGSWPFSTADIGYPITDCTADGLKVALLLSKLPSEIVGEKIEANRLYDAVNVILSFMNKNGGIGSYTVQKTYSWLELFNPSKTFEDCMVDHPCVECTSSCIQGLTSFMELYPDHRRNEVEKYITKAASYIEKMQRSDGSWLATWGICFTYATWFAVCGLVANGRTYDNSSCIRKACNFLLSKQEISGGWGESYLSLQNKSYTSLGESRCHPANTAWAMLALLKAGQAKVNPNPIHRAAKVLINMQLESGEFPRQGNLGASSGSMIINSSEYCNVFPIWALGEYRTWLAPHHCL